MFERRTRNDAFGREGDRGGDAYHRTRSCSVAVASQEVTIYVAWCARPLPSMPDGRFARPCPGYDRPRAHREQVLDCHSKRAKLLTVLAAAVAVKKAVDQFRAGRS